MDEAEAGGRKAARAEGCWARARVRRGGARGTPYVTYVTYVTDVTDVTAAHEELHESRRAIEEHRDRDELREWESARDRKQRRDACDARESCHVTAL